MRLQKEMSKGVDLFKERLPTLVLYFKTRKIINDTVDKLRRSLYHSKLHEGQRDVIKGIRWLLLKNCEDIKTEAARKKLEEGLKVN